MTIRLIFLSAKKRHGKDTLANHLVEKHGFTRVAYADALKDEVARDYNMDRASFDDEATKDDPTLIEHLGMTRRQLLQHYGVKRRQETENYWKDRGDEKINEVLLRGGKVVVSDVRFDNELIHTGIDVFAEEVLRVRITRPALTASDEHISETALDNYAHFDAYIINEEGDPNAMRDAMENLLR